MGIFNKREVREFEPPPYPVLPVSDPSVLEYFGVTQRNLAGVSVTEQTILGIPGVFRAVSLISGTIAGLPLKSYRDVRGEHREIRSFLDNPGLDLLTPFEWKELCLVNLLVHGNAFFIKIYNQGGAIAGLHPVHPSLVSVAWDEKAQEKVYKVRAANGAEREFTDNDVLHIKGLGTDFLVGLSPLTIHRLSFATEIAGNDAAGSAFGSGLMIAGLITSTDTHFTAEEAKVIKAEVEGRMTGSRNAGKVPVLNRDLKFVPLTQTGRDAQFIESRAFQIEEISRIFGVPPHLLAQTQKQTSWGTGVAEQNVGLARYTLQPWTNRIQERLSRLLEPKEWVEFEFKGLFKGTPKEELEMLVMQKDAGLLTLNECRAILNLPALEEAPNGSEEEQGSTGAEEGSDGTGNP